MNNCFSPSIQIPVEQSTNLLIVSYVVKIPSSRNNFLDEVNPHQDFIFKVCNWQN